MMCSPHLFSLACLPSCFLSRFLFLDFSFRRVYGEEPDNPSVNEARREHNQSIWDLSAIPSYVWQLTGVINCRRVFHPCGEPHRLKGRERERERERERGRQWQHHKYRGLLLTNTALHTNLFIDYTIINISPISLQLIVARNRPLRQEEATWPTWKLINHSFILFLARNKVKACSN